MSKIFRRPMFRGGSTNNKMSGIMSGINDTPRRQYNAGTTFEEIVAKNPRLGEDVALLNSIRGDTSGRKSDIIAKLLIEGGLNVVSGTGAGKGTLGSIAESFKAPTEKALTSYEKLKGEEALTKGTAVSQFFKDRTAKDLAQSNLEQKKATSKQFESGTPASQAKNYLEGVSGMAKNAYTASQKEAAQAKYDLTYSVYPQIVQGFANGVGIKIAPVNSREELREWVQTQSEQSRFIDPTSQKWKMVMTNPETGKKDIVLLDQNTLLPPE